MNPAPTFDRAYPIIKRRVLRGDWRPLERIDVGQLAHDLDVSTIPVREALQRLVGEHLTDLAPGGGFAVVHLSATALRALYHWHAQLLRMALRHAMRGAIIAPVIASDAEGPEALALFAEAVFAAIGAVSSNIEHVQAIVSAGERLRRVRIVESRLVRGVEAELNQVCTLTESGRSEALRDMITAYHRRRLRRVPQLIANLASFDEAAEDRQFSSSIS